MVSIMTLIAYGTAINHALANARTSLEDLKVLRDHATARGITIKATRPRQPT